MHEQKRKFHLAQSSTPTPPHIQKVPAFSETRCNCANFCTTSHFFVCFYTSQHVSVYWISDYVSTVPPLSHAYALKVLLSRRNYCRYSPIPSAAKLNSPVDGTNTKQPNLGWIGPSFFSFHFRFSASEPSAASHPTEVHWKIPGRRWRPRWQPPGARPDWTWLRWRTRPGPSESWRRFACTGCGPEEEAGGTRWHTIYAEFTIISSSENDPRNPKPRLLNGRGKPAQCCWQALKVQTIALQQACERHPAVTPDHFPLNVKKIIVFSPSSAWRPPWQPGQ